MDTLKRVWAWLTRGRLVWLLDFDGSSTLSIARQNAWGMWTAKRYWPLTIKIVILNDDGTIAHSTYVERWKDA